MYLTPLMHTDFLVEWCQGRILFQRVEGRSKMQLSSKRSHCKLCKPNAAIINNVMCPEEDDVRSHTGTNATLFFGYSGFTLFFLRFVATPGCGVEKVVSTILGHVKPFVSYPSDKSAKCLPNKFSGWTFKFAAYLSRKSFLVLCVVGCIAV